LAALLVTAQAGAQDAPGFERFVPKGPAPRFIIPISVNEAKGEVLFWVQVVAQGPLDRLAILEDRDGNQRHTLGSKPSFTIPIEGFRVPFGKGKWSTADGKEIAAGGVAARLKPGGIVLLSADGEPVNTAYLRMFNDDVLVLVVPAEDLPIPYMPLTGSTIPIKRGDGR
jgi:hypothetical protein